MRKITLREMIEGDFMIMNMYESPLRNEDFDFFMKKKLLIYEEPLESGDKYYETPWLLYGYEGYVRLDNYFFKEKALEELRERGYQLEIDTLEDQKKRKEENEKRRYIEYMKELIFNTIFNYIRENGLYLNTLIDFPKGEIFDGPENKKYFDITIYGDGRWIVNENGRLWAIKNNGGVGEDYNYRLNNIKNVITGGYGAIGHYIETDDFFVKTLRRIFNEKGEFTKESLEKIYFDITKYVEKKEEN